MKMGIEIEYWVIDDRGDLCDGRDLTEVHDRVKPEFIPPLIEVQTSPVETRHALERELQEVLSVVLAEAEASDRQLVPLGTPLSRISPSVTNDRGELFEEIYGGGILSAKNSAGTHVHFEKGSVVDQINLLTALDPAIALLSSSPYYCGRFHRNCSRAHAYRYDAGEEFLPYTDLWPYAESVEERRERVDRVHERFVDLAAEKGISRDRLEEHFSPPNTILTPVRLREELPTVEWRAPDSAPPSQVVQLAADVRLLVLLTEEMPVEIAEPETPTDQFGVGSDRILVPDFETLEYLTKQAIRWGTDAPAVETYLQAMGFDLDRYDPLSMRIDQKRRIGKRDAREIRLEFAGMLARDVSQLAKEPDIGSPSRTAARKAPQFD